MNKLKIEFLPPGALVFRTAPTIIRTTLGSCISVIIYDEQKKISGMCHYLNSNGIQIEKENQNQYGEFAIENLIEKFRIKGSTLNTLKAKIFGGASITTSNDSAREVSRQNIEMAMNILKKYSIEITERNIRGKYGREIKFNSTDYSVEVETQDPSAISGIREIFEFISHKTGNEADSRASVFHSEIKRHMRDLKITDYQVYKEKLFSTRKIAEDLISKITNHTTEWFRYPSQLIEINKLLKGRTSSINILSAGSSTGEEAYSLALSIQLKLPHLKFQITGLDVDAKAVKSANDATYDINELIHIPNEYHSKLIIKNDHFKVSNMIKDFCSFETRDLRKILSLQNNFDIIICQNVLIYFSAENQSRIIRNFVKILNEEGKLYLSRKEATDIPKLTMEAPGIYKKTK